MIFVTVGTHEQAFDRLIEEIDRLKANNCFDDEVVIQRGYSKYTPKYCQYFDMLSYEEMKEYQNKARIIITHGGPASFIYPLSIGKMPIVVPRQKKYNEHINDHQFEFTNQLKERGFPIIVVDDIKDLEKSIANVNDDFSYTSNTSRYNDELIDEIKGLF